MIIFFKNGLRCLNPCCLLGTDISPRLTFTGNFTGEYTYSMTFHSSAKNYYDISVICFSDWLPGYARRLRFTEKRYEGQCYNSVFIAQAVYVIVLEKMIQLVPWNTQENLHHNYKRKKVMF